MPDAPSIDEVITGAPAPEPAPSAAAAEVDPSATPAEGADSGAGAKVEPAADAKPTARTLADLNRAQAQARLARKQANERVGTLQQQLDAERKARAAYELELADLKKWREAKEKEGLPALSALTPEQAEEAIRGYVKDSDPAVVARRAEERATAAEKLAKKAADDLEAAKNEYSEAGRKRQAEAEAAQLDAAIAGFVRAVTTEKAEDYPHLTLEYEPSEIAAQVRDCHTKLAAAGHAYTGLEIAAFLERQAKVRYDRRAEREAKRAPAKAEDSGVAHRDKNGQGQPSKPGNGRRDKPGQKNPPARPAETEAEQDARLAAELKAAFARDAAKAN